MEKGDLAPHSYVEGKCSCGATDPNYVAPAPDVKLEDAESGSKLEIPTGSTAVIPEGTDFNVEKLLTTEETDGFLVKVELKETEKATLVAFYDINLLLDGAPIQPNGNVLVTLPAIEGDYAKVIVIYVADDGSIEECVTTVNPDGTISFETDHFSKYAVVGITEDSTPGTDTPGTDVPGTDVPGTDKPEDPDDGLSGGAIAGIVTGSVVVLSGGGFALWWFVFRKKKLF